MPTLKQLLLQPILMTALLAVFSTALAADAPALIKETDTAESLTKAKNNPVIRGGIVFLTYCVLCHGERGDGLSRGTKLYGAANLGLKPNSREYTEKIVRNGGKSVGKSEFMPSWNEELSEEQMGDVIAYLLIVQNQIERGAVVFKTNCILCHGINGDGKGRASVFYDPRPANLTTSDKNDAYKKQIITLGGKAMGRSEVMPMWGEQLLTEQQIDDVVAYLRTIVVVQK